MNDYTVSPLSPIRKIIGARMLEATQSIPHFRLAAQIELDALLGLRNTLNSATPDAPLSINDFLIKACASALMDVPAVNVQWVKDEIHQYKSADISVVMSLKPGGLATPIVRGADSKSIREISREVKELAARAANNTLKMQEIIGGSFSLSNLGMYGIDHFDAIINPPQCAILAIGTATPRVLATARHGTRIATVLTATLSCDHRAIDGAIGAAFLLALRDRLGHPEHF
jgi:pyruvate dehydrogenase E2 component (dihydrolipoamide acetyltransferase)